MGKGGQRGISKKWNIYINVEWILSNTKKILKKWDVKMADSEFLSLIGFHARGDELIDKYDVRTQKALLHTAL